MGWYKDLKLAMPVVQAPPIEPHWGNGWFDVGHENYLGNKTQDQEKLWIISNDWRFNIMNSVGQETHMQDFAGINWLAKGRWTSKDGGTCSLILRDEREKISNPQKYQYKHDKVVQLLEKKFGPATKIIDFNNQFSMR